MNCYCLDVEKDEFCKHCRQLRASLSYIIRKVCVESKDVPAEFKLKEIEGYLMRRLNANPIFFYSEEINSIKMSLDSPN